MEVRLLAADQIAAAAGVLARGFQDDPLLVHMIPDAATRAAVLPIHFSALVRLGLEAGDVLAMRDASQGTAVCFGPGREVGDAALQQAGVTALPAQLPDGAFARFEAFTAPLGRLHRRDAPMRHWYVALLGVDPRWQGRGLGGRLLSAVLERADADGVPCYLETVQPRNVPFYERHGFTVVVSDVDRASGLRFWTFLRDPR